MTGVLTSAGLDVFGLQSVRAPATWWVACSAAFVGSVALCWHVATVIMSRPSSASDVLELGWDDLFRFKRVRGLVVATAWAPTLLLLPIEGVLSSAFSGASGESFLPWEADAVLAVMVIVVFRQGRHLWRRAWEARQPGMGAPR